jgi:glutamyl-tRNA(Gln) amidotransferase subunit E
MGKQARGEGLLVGLELHQQLACSTKLFCACPPAKSEQLPYHFERRLRPAQSETGKLDPAAVFEFSKGKSNTYFWNPESSCLVEADEEPPHPMSEEALDAALLTARALGSKVVDEVHVMRKIVIDGSNTSGFQRTGVVGLGGEIMVDGTRVRVQSVTLEEDAARLLGEDDSARSFAIDRLGVALVEVALDPVSGDPELVGKVALHLGRVLRSTGTAARGLGTIRQDLNVSLRGGMVVEVKGVQKLNLLPRVIEYERRRQRGLVAIAEKLRERGVERVRCRVLELTHLAASTSKVVREQVAKGGKAAVIVAEGLGGLLGWEPFPGVRLGREVAEVARSNSLGGVIHSDEFERQGITGADADELRRASGAGKDDALIVVAGPPATVDACVPQLVARLEGAPEGVPAETRAPTDTGETRYMRPRPGSQRMYPETDIPEIEVSGARLAKISRREPESWESRVAKLSKGYSLSADLALKLYDSDLDGAFVDLCRDLRVEPSVVASVLVDLPARLGREGVQEGALTLGVLGEALRAVSKGAVAKEAIPDVLKEAGGRGVSIEEAIRSLGIRTADERQIRETIDTLLAREAKLVREKKADAFSQLMGEAMKELRGRADGALVGRILKERLAQAAVGAEA